MTNAEQFQSDIESFKAGRDEAKSGIENLERDLAKLVERAKKEEVRPIFSCAISDANC
jgi:hypothetical protein